MKSLAWGKHPRATIRGCRIMRLHSQTPASSCVTNTKYSKVKMLFDNDNSLSDFMNTIPSSRMSGQSFGSSIVRLYLSASIPAVSNRYLPRQPQPSLYMAVAYTAPCQYLSECTKVCLTQRRCLRVAIEAAIKSSTLTLSVLYHI